MFENASEDFKRANPGLFVEEHGAGSVGHGDEVKCERDLQYACERWLELRGYCRRTEGRILKGPPERGYFVHLHKAVGNPLLLDVLILGNDGRYLEVELKTETGRVEPFQQKLVKDQGPAALVRDLAGFCGEVVKWEECLEPPFDKLRAGKKAQKAQKSGTGHGRRGEDK